MDPRYIDFFLASHKTTVQFETLEISHSQFSQPYRVVRNNACGLTVELEDALGEAHFEYVPIRIKENATKGDLDYGISVTFGDLGELIPTEMENVRAGDSFAEKPKLIYRSYRSDDLTSPMFGPINLEIVKFNFDQNGCTFEAQAPVLKLTKTGEIYDKKRFTGLQGL